MLRKIIPLLIVIFGVCLGSDGVLAYYQNPFNSQPGFTHSVKLQGDDTLAGKMLDGAHIFRSSPVVGDLDGNPANGLEIVVGDRNGKLFALRNNGDVLWTAQVTTCSIKNDESVLNGAPTLFDLRPDSPGLEVIVGYGKVHIDPTCPGGVVAYSATGQLLWRYSIPVNPISGTSSVFATPSVTDVDGNGDIIIAFGATDLFLHVLNKDGTLRWKYFAMDTIWSSPAFADVDGDGRKDIIVGTDFTPGRVCNPNSITPFPETNSYIESAKGFLYAFPADAHLRFKADPIYCAHDGGKVIGFGKGFIWSVRFLDQSIYSSPAIADLDNDGRLEIVVGSGCFYGGDPKPGKWVKIFDLETGREEMTLNAPECVASSPAVGDLDGDGYLDIVATVASGGSSNPPVATPLEGGQIVAWRYNDPNPFWSVPAYSATQEGADMSEAFNNPLIADIDGNGSHEVIVVVQNSVMVYSGREGLPLTPVCPPGGPIANNCRVMGTKAMFMWMPIRNTPAIADIDNDGKLEIVAAGSHTSYDQPAMQDRAFVYVWRDIEQGITSEQGPYQAYSAPWPQFQRDPAHNGALLPRRIRVDVPQVTALAEPGEDVTVSIPLRSVDGTTIRITVEARGPISIAQLDTTMSLIRSNSTLQNVTLELNRPALLRIVLSTFSELGSYDGSIVLRGDNVPEVTIPVSVKVVERVYRTHIPITTR